MQAFADFIAMGGYAAYVWPAYGAAVVLLGGLLWASLRRLRRSERLLRQLENRDASGRRAPRQAVGADWREAPAVHR